MKKVFLLLCLFVTVASASAQEVRELTRNDERFIEPQYYNMITLHAGYSMFNVALGKYGYNVSVEYNTYLTPKLYLLGSYVHAYSNNTEKYKATDNDVRGSIQDHIIAVGFGYDMLKMRGHRIYGALAVGAGYQSYKHDIVMTEFPFTKSQQSEKGWNIAYFPTVGYGYSFVENAEIGLSWAGYFVQKYWANSFNIHVGYRF